jgi:hypothetical protein
MKIELDLSAKDYLRAISIRHVFLRRLLPFAVVLAIVLICIDVLSAVTGDWPLLRLEHRMLTFTLPWFAICFCSYFGWVVVSSIWNCQSAVRRHPELYKNVSVEFDERDFKIISRHAMAHWAWSEMLGYKEHRSIFELCPNKQAKFVIPRRALLADEGAAFARIVREKLQRL